MARPSFKTASMVAGFARIQLHRKSCDFSYNVLKPVLVEFTKFCTIERRRISHVADNRPWRKRPELLTCDRAAEDN
jgi:hypothetical protein